MYLYRRGLASFLRFTAHAQLAACPPLLHHSLLSQSQHNFLHTCFVSLSGQNGDYCGRKCLQLIGCPPVPFFFFTCCCSMNTNQPILQTRLCADSVLYPYDIVITLEHMVKIHFCIHQTSVFFRLVGHDTALLKSDVCKMSSVSPRSFQSCCAKRCFHRHLRGSGAPRQ